MRLRVKRVTEAPAAEDGARVLVDRLWPRGQSKDKLHLDAWLKDIAPGDTLRKWFNHEPEKWPQFQERYAKELDAHPDAVNALQDMLREHGTVTLLFGSHEAHCNNAVALLEYLKSAAKAGRFLNFAIRDDRNANKHMPRTRSASK